MKRAIVLLALGLAACQKPPAPPAPPRPVLSMQATETLVDPLALAGTIVSQVQTPFSFRTLGRLVSRPVNIGDVVKKGQTLGAIDAISLQFAVRSAEADVASAEAQLANAIGVDERTNALLKTNASTQAQVDAADQARAAAQAGQTRARAAFAKTREDLDYAVLKADFDGVVTNTGAEVGQTVSPGEMVVELADPRLRDAVIDAPDSAASTLKLGSEFVVAAELDPSVQIHGKVREIAPQADAATRTRRVKIALEKPPDAFRLGSTITAFPAENARRAVRLPASAILDKDGKTLVWVVDPATAKVATRPVKLAASGVDPVEVTSGLEPNMRVVTAGVHSLAEGQSVRIDEQAKP